MSYDIYCYRSQLGVPDLAEANAVLDAEENEDEKVVADPTTKLKIAKALLDHHPTLESTEFDFEKAATLLEITHEDAAEQFDHIELTTPEDEMGVQITIYNNNVMISIPYWYSGDREEAVFNKLEDYIRIIRQTAGYFVYDPQNDTVYDPLVNNQNGIPKYQEGVKIVEEIRNNSTATPKKPWWKFW